ncbi:MAG: bifunctional demethylmenaquinone methyltransferase/2-methoxy-6-polyprenyl-1,4-benzoquinol methylase UbiE [Bacteroidales bacterium]
MKKSLAPSWNKDKISAMFDSIAVQYDVLNSILSIGVERYWRRFMLKIVKAHKPNSIIDIAAGTGSSTFAMQKSGAKCIVGVDISPQMLKVALRKRKKRQIDFIHVDGETLPFSNASFDVATIAFGIRNFEDRIKSLKEILRILKDKGVLVILELSLPTNAIIRRLYKWYFFHILPVVGGLVSKNKQAYQYLPQSVAAFPTAKEFVLELETAGFEVLQVRALTMGLSTIYEVRK